MKSIKLQKMQEAGNTLSFSIELLAEPISIFTFNSFDVAQRYCIQFFNKGETSRKCNRKWMTKPNTDKKKEFCPMEDTSKRLKILISTFYRNLIL